MVLQAGHYDPEAIRSCAEKVAVHWQQLMLKMEDRLKLVNASVAFYKTSEQVHVKHRVCVQCCEHGGCQWCHQLFASVQVCSVLESLEQEYRRDEDWCGSHDKLGLSAESDHLLPLISKHLEQKEAFLKVIMSQNRLMCFSTESEENKCRINYETEKNVHLDLISKLHEGLYTILRDEMLKDDGEIKIRQDE